jgi:hypothetical protein
MGASQLAGLKPAADVLLQSPKGSPLLVVQELGQGRSAVLAFDSTWKWSLASDSGVEAQRRFWRQLVLWLTNRRPQVWVNVERPHYLLNRLRAGDHVLIRAGAAGVKDASGVTLEGEIQQLSRDAATPAAREAPQRIVWTRNGETFEARPDISAAGDYRVRVRARDTSGSLGEAEAAFSVESPNLELIDPLADLSTLKQLAAATVRQGGAFIPLDGIPAVLDRLAAAAQSANIERIERRRLVADSPWPWLIAFASLLVTEWVLRRRAGLV